MSQLQLKFNGSDYIAKLERNRYNTATICEERSHNLQEMRISLKKLQNIK